jgi:hypothetical protein
MSFAETFHELRKRRRLSMTAWEEPVNIASPYVNDVEKKGLLPGPEKLEQLVAVFVDVAGEQGAADPQEDARLLWREHDRELFVKRLGIDPHVAEAFVSVREVVREGEIDPDHREELLKTIQQVVETLPRVDREQQSELLEHLRRTVEDYAPREATDGDRELQATR